MTDLRTIVVAVDFSPGSRRALGHAADLARRTGATLHLLHADVLFGASGDGAPAVGGRSLHVRVERFARSAVDPDTAPTAAVVSDVSPAAAILRYLAFVDADLLVMGTHGRSGLARLAMGSVAASCVASAPCPVFAVPSQADESAPDAPVLVAVDFGERSRDALAMGAAFASLYGGAVELVHVVRDAGPYPGFAPNVLSLVDYDPERGEAVRQRLRRFAEQGEAPPVGALHVSIGAPSRLVPRLAAERGARAIVMGTHGRAGVVRALLGSVAEATLRRASCPVLTLRQAETERPAPSAPLAP